MSVLDDSIKKLLNVSLTKEEFKEQKNKLST